VRLILGPKKPDTADLVERAREALTREFDESLGTAAQSE